MTNKEPQREFTGPDVCALDAHEVVSLLKRRELSAAELLEASLARISQTEDAINAIPTVCADRARASLEDLPDRARQQSNEPGWLGGMPIGIKDLTPVAGVRTTFGTKGMANNVPDQSDPLVLRLENNGGVVVGKTNTPEFGAGGNTFNDVFGATRNPWNTQLNAGGSSGGAAASLASGEVWLSHGSDLAGSLRTPAAYCGVVGLRPSPGRAGSGPTGLGFHTEGVQGPMARNVRDCALFLDAMAGFDPRSPISFPAPDTSFQDAVIRAGSNVRIAYSKDLNGFAPVAKSMDADIRSALSLVEKNGGMVEETCPELPHLDHTYRALRAMLWAAGPGRAPQEVQQHFKQTLAENIDYGRRLTIDDVYDAQINRSAIFDNMVALFDSFDVLACPTVGLPAGPVEEEFPTTVDGQPLNDYIEWLRFSYLATTAALPAISLPVGLDANGMPVGIQLIGKPRGEAELLAVARAVEVAVGGPLGAIDPNVTHRQSR